MYSQPQGYVDRHAYGPVQAVAPPIHQTTEYRDLEPHQIHLEIRQQPKEALVTADGKEKTRKPVDPPPIVELKVVDGVDPVKHYLQSPYLFMVCSLVEGESDDVIEHEDNKPPLSGALVSSLHRLKDTTNIDGAFFVFGDVSARVVGTFRLKFSLFDCRFRGNVRNQGCVHLKTSYSEPFNVVNQKDFQGLDESTYLSRAFSDQGVRLRLRKEPRTFAGAKKRRYNDDMADSSLSAPPVDTGYAQPPGNGYVTNPTPSYENAGIATTAYTSVQSANPWAANPYYPS